MHNHRPEIGARLDHLGLWSNDPSRLAAFFEQGFDMTKTSAAGQWRCKAPERELLIAEGPPNRAAFVAYALKDRAGLEQYHADLMARSLALGANPSPQFDTSAFSVIDPDGNISVFGVRERAPAAVTAAFPGRLQHVAFRTPRLDEMAVFYERELGFVVSDRVLDERDVLHACFLRSDAEHHVLALFRSPETRLDHHSYETRDWAHIRLWADRMGAHRIPIFWGVGRHGPGNDVFFMVKDADDNLVEISAELEGCAADRPIGAWPHEQHTLNLWGSAIMRS
jgi:catechol 2,3-dioxygenase-like lactoylglutathione lyase family enzyme